MLIGKHLPMVKCRLLPSTLEEAVMKITYKNGSLSRNTSGCTSWMSSALSQMTLARLVLRISFNCSKNQKACKDLGS